MGDGENILKDCSRPKHEQQNYREDNEGCVLRKIKC